MCSINAIFQTSGHDYSQEIIDMTAYSFIQNPHAEGMYMSFGNKVVKSEKRLNVLELLPDIRQSNVVIFHERLATSGGNDVGNIHPFENERFVLVHNGVFYNGYSYHESDTSRFFKQFVAEFAKVKNVKKAVQRALAASGGGTYSILLYDKKAEVGYYFKNWSTQMSVVTTKDGDLAFCTEEEAVMFLDVDYDHYLAIAPDELYTIKVSNDGKYEMKSIGILKNDAGVKPATAAWGDVLAPPQEKGWIGGVVFAAWLFALPALLMLMLIMTVVFWMFGLLSGFDKWLEGGERSGVSKFRIPAARGFARGRTAFPGSVAYAQGAVAKKAYSDNIEWI